MIYPCQRCKEIFKSQEAVGLHLKEVKGCELRDIEIGDGITNEIKRKLTGTRPRKIDGERFTCYSSPCGMVPINTRNSSIGLSHAEIDV